jgi:O-antigen/teichoic acid export membrane protein
VTPLERRIDNVLRFAPFLFAFVGAKGAAFFGMLAIGRYADPPIYGAIEFALTFGLIGATLALIGLTGAATRLALVDGDPRILDLFAWTVVGIGTIALAVAATAVAINQWAHALGILMVPIAAAQFTAGTYFRIREWKVGTALSDTFAVMSMLAAAGATASAIGKLDVKALVVALLAINTAVTLGGLAIAVSRSAENLQQRAVAAAALGLPMMGADLVGQVLTQGGRLGLGAVGSMDDVGIYSAVFRIAAGLVLAHQLLWGAYYAKLYRLEGNPADQIYAVIMVGFALVGLSLSVALQQASSLAFPQYVVRASELFVVIPLVCAQVVQWIYFSMLTTRIQRSGAAFASGVALAALLVFATFALTLLAWFGLASLIKILILFTAVFFLANVSLYVLLLRRGEKLQMTLAAVIIGLVAATPALVPY